tara:strand:- start:364 stop:609 length:246 start_codon:yes stop_codon:yes gene_type:complete
MNSTVWIITALLWFEGVNEPRFSEYNLKQFTGRGACLDHIFWSKAELVEELYSVHETDEEGNKISTWAFFCEGRKIELLNT